MCSELQTYYRGLLLLRAASTMHRQKCFFFLLLHGNAEQSCRCKNMWSAAAASAMEDSEPNRTARPSQKKKHRLSQCMHGNGNAFTVEDNFLSFHILSTARRSGTRNKYGGLAQKIKRRGKQQAARHDLHLLPSSSTSGSSRR
jgi:hypothetical protein